MKNILIISGIILFLTSCAGSKPIKKNDVIYLWNIDKKKSLQITKETPELYQALKDYKYKTFSICQVKKSPCFGLGSSVYESFLELVTTTGCKDSPVSNITCDQYFLK